VVQQRFALLWGPGAYDIYNAKMQKKKNARKLDKAQAEHSGEPLGDPSAWVFDPWF